MTNYVYLPVVVIWDLFLPNNVNSYHYQNCGCRFFDIFPKDNQCPVLGIKLSWGGRRENGNSPSLDRINPIKGYVKGNVMWMSHRANAMKQNATPIEMKLFAKWVVKTIK